MTDYHPQTPPAPHNAQDDKTKPQTPQPPAEKPEEIGGPQGPEPTRYGDWERKGRCVDF